MVPKVLNLGQIQTGWFVAIVATALIIVIVLTAVITNATNKP